MARGSLVKRAENTWSAIIELGRDEHGKRKQKWVTIKGTKLEAEKELNKLQAAADQGTIVASPKMTLGEYLDVFLREHVDPNLTPKSVRYYHQVCQYYIRPHLGRVVLDRLQPGHVLRVLATLRAAPRRDKKPGPVSPTTVHHTFKVLHTALAVAVKWRLLPTNPMAGLEAPASADVEMRYFTAEQAVAVLAAADDEGPHWRAFLSVAMTGGLRLGELLGARWQDVDWARGTLSVRQSIHRIPKVGLVRKSPKGKRSRVVALGADVLAALRTWKATQNAARLGLGGAWHDEDLIFPSGIGTPLDEHAVWRHFRAICARAGVAPIRIHDLRHTSATLLLAAGVSPKVVSERLGHSNVSITLNVYSHVGATLQQAAADTLDVMLRQGRRDGALANG